MNRPTSEEAPSPVALARTSHHQALTPRREDAPSAGHPSSPTAPKSRLPFDPWRLLAALKHGTPIIMASAAGVAALLGITGYFQSESRVQVRLIAREPAAVSSVTASGTHRLAPETQVSLMQSPELARRVAASLPAGSEDSLRGRLHVAATADLVILSISGKKDAELVGLANRFADEAVAMGRELQSAESRQLDYFCTEKLAALDRQLSEVNAQLVAFQAEEKLADPDAEKQGYVRQLSEAMARADNARIETELVALQIESLTAELAQQNPVARKLEAARDQLTELYGRYTEAHPTVVGQRKLIAELERQVEAANSGSLATARYSEDAQVRSMYSRLTDLQTRKSTLQREQTELVKLRDVLHAKVSGLSEKSLHYATIKAQLEGLQQTRAQLAARQREAQLIAENAQGYYRVFAPATNRDINKRGRWMAASAGSVVGLLCGAFLSGLVVVGREAMDRRIKTAADVKRETGLPVLASLGDLNRMTPEQRDAWAFRAWTAIAGQLNASPNQGLVCGFISSRHGEGCSTWIDLLVGAAQQRGLQVVKVSAGPGQTAPPADRDARHSAPSMAEPDGPSAPGNPVALTRAPEARIPLPGKVWELAHRQEWERWLAQLRRHEHFVLLVELPPASVPEAVLLAESLPQLIWLADSGTARARETRELLQTLRYGNCRLAGAVLNHEPQSLFEL